MGPMLPSSAALMAIQMRSARISMGVRGDDARLPGHPTPLPPRSGATALVKLGARTGPDGPSTSLKLHTATTSGSVVRASSSKARTGPDGPSTSLELDTAASSGSVVRASSSKAGRPRGGIKRIRNTRVPIRHSTRLLGRRFYHPLHNQQLVACSSKAGRPPGGIKRIRNQARAVW